MGKAGVALGLSVAVLLGSCVQQDTPPTAVNGDADTAAQLEALGYLEWAEGEDDLTRFGVLRDDPRAGDGVTLYKSRPAPEAQLIDRSGGVLHTWRAPRLDVEDWRSLVALVYRRGSKVSWARIRRGSDTLVPNSKPPSGITGSKIPSPPRTRKSLAIIFTSS